MITFGTRISFKCSLTAAKDFSLKPPIVIELPRKSTSPVIPTSFLNGLLITALRIAVEIATPADGPSFGVAPSGACM